MNARVSSWWGAQNHTWLLLAAGSVVVLLWILLVAMAVLAQPIADDYRYFSNIRMTGLGDYIHSFYTSETGRYGQGFIVAVAYYLFGVAAVKIVPIIELLLLAGSLSWLAYLVVPFKQSRLFLSLLTGSLSSAVFIFSFVSLFDSFLWLTSSTVYMFSLVALVLDICLVVLLYRNKVKSWLVPFLLFTLFIGQSFSEPTAIIAIVLALSYLGYVIFRHKQKIATAALVNLSLIGGLLVVILSPGSEQRQPDLVASLDIFDLLFQYVLYFGRLAFALEPWKFGLMIFTAYFLHVTVTAIAKKRLQALLVAGVLIGILPALITFGATHLAIESVPLRAYTLPMVGVVTGVVLIFFVLLRFYSSRLRSVRYLPALVVVAALSLVFALLHGVTIAKAELLRSEIVTRRDAHVKTKVRAGAAIIRLTPAPILVEKTDARDLEYRKHQTTQWFLPGFRRYYRIPSNTSLKIDTTQPQDYCLHAQPADFTGAKSCKKLN